MLLKHMKINALCIFSALCLFVAPTAYSKSVICKTFGLNEPQIIAQNRCPLGYTLVGEVPVIESNNDLLGTGRLVEQMNAREEARIQREHELRLERERIRALAAAQATEQQRQAIENSRLEENSKCLQGTWRINGGDDKQGVALDISDRGLVFLNGNLATGAPNVTQSIVNNSLHLRIYGQGDQAGESAEFYFRLENGVFKGTLTRVEVKKGFLLDKPLPPKIVETEAERISEAIVGCEPIILEENNTTLDSKTSGKLIAEGLTELSVLYEKGLLSEEEYNAAKRKLLGL